MGRFIDGQQGDLMGDEFAEFRFGLLPIGSVYNDDVERAIASIAPQPAELETFGCARLRVSAISIGGDDFEALTFRPGRAEVDLLRARVLLVPIGPMSGVDRRAYHFRISSKSGTRSAHHEPHSFEDPLPVEVGLDLDRSTGQASPHTRRKHNPGLGPGQPVNGGFSPLFTQRSHVFGKAA
ncbi:MAG TPA: hypothetical protein VG757_16995 [Devosia sp.]|nr:hypothetical protein [Devosia sp.]